MAIQFNPNDDLIAGIVAPFPTVSVVFAQGTDKFERGAVLKTTSQKADGTYVVELVSDVADTPFTILADPFVDPTDGETPATGFVGGEFNRDALIFGGTVKVEDMEEKLRNVGLITKRVVK
ncbi:hypothetical protein D1872_54710 [compost metagenome]